jgi:hypothetical protein
MASPTRPTKLRVDRDGVRIETTGVRGRIWLLVAAMGVVLVALLVLVRHGQHELPDKIVAAAPRRPMARAPDIGRAVRPPDKPLRAAVAVAEPVAPPPAAHQQPPPTLAEPAQPASEDAPAQEAPMFGTGAPGEGIAVFPPPGTKPIKQGILVPDDFELPPGYVRHYQATDDGQRVPAILMFHPDYHPVDAHGVPIPLPENRVVPPDMAPPGMPIEMLQVPEQGENPDTPEPQGSQDATP